MPSQMTPLFGLSITGDPIIEVSKGDFEMALDDTPLLRSAMERMIKPDIAPDAGLSNDPRSPEPNPEQVYSPATPTPFKR